MSDRPISDNVSGDAAADAAVDSSWLYRAFEILPGAIAWITLILIVVLSRYLPFWMAIFIIFFDTYWLLKTVYLSLHLRSTFGTMRENLKKSWLPEVKKISGWDKVRHLVILPMYKEPYDVVRETFETLAKANYPLDKFIIVSPLRNAPESKGKAWP